MITKRPFDGGAHAVSGGGGSFLRAVERSSPSSDPGMLHPSARSRSRPSGAARRAADYRLVVPHAGYAYSGPIAAHGYAALAADGWPSSFVILGPNHHGA